MSRYIPGEVNVCIDDDELYNCDDPSKRLGYMIYPKKKVEENIKYPLQIKTKQESHHQPQYNSLSNSHLKKKYPYDIILKSVGIPCSPKVNQVLVLSTHDILSNDESDETLYELVRNIKQTSNTDEYLLLKKCVDCKSNYYPVKLVTESITNSSKDLGNVVRHLFTLQKIMNDKSKLSLLQSLL